MKEKKEIGNEKKVKTFQYGLLLHFFRTAGYRDYGGPMKPFSFKSRTFGLGQINSGAFGVFSANLSAPILVQ